MGSFTSHQDFAKFTLEPAEVEMKAIPTWRVPSESRWSVLGTLTMWAAERLPTLLPSPGENQSSATISLEVGPVPMAGIRRLCCPKAVMSLCSFEYHQPKTQVFDIRQGEVPLLG